MFDLLGNFKHKAEIRESKDEILIGEIVRAMSRFGCPSIRFAANDDFQRVGFRALKDELLHAVHVQLDRKTGTGAVGSALFGSKATLTITCEIKNYLADPDDLVAMYKTDLANIFKMPILGGVKLNHELNSIYATTTRIIEIDDYVLKGEPGVQRFSQLLGGTIAELKERLRPYKKA